jgi:hypothetical protein
MLPQEVGAAAAYEAYRQIKYGSNMYQFLYSDYERQREALRGLAVAERTSLINPSPFTSHVIDSIITSRAPLARYGPHDGPIWPTGRL